MFQVSIRRKTYRLCNWVRQPLHLGLTLASILNAVYTLPAQAQVQPTFSCDGAAYVGQKPPGVNFHQLSQLDTSTNPISFTNVGGTNHGFSYNAIGFNVNDGYLYGKSGRRVVRIGSDGSVVNLGEPTLPNGNTVNGGFIGDVGFNDKFYVMANNTTLYEVDLTNSPLTYKVINLNDRPRTADFAFNPRDQKLYAVQSNSKRLVIIDPNAAANQVTTRNLTGDQFQGAQGAVFFDSNGTLFPYSNSGRLYRVDLDTNTMTYLAPAGSSKSNDGASCILRPILEKQVTPSTLQIESTGNLVPPVTYTFSVGHAAANNAPLSGLNFIDNPGIFNNPANSPVYNGTWQNVEFSLDGGTNWTPVANGGSGPGGVGGTVAITGSELRVNNFTLPATQNGDPGFTLLIRAEYDPIDTLPTGMYRNQAQVTGIPASLGGSLISDDPTTGPTPDPTKITVLGLSPIISGRVFEDITYGGGSGRAYSPSQPAVVPGATVELYKDQGGGNFTKIAQTTTAADGTYSFDKTDGTIFSTNFRVRVVNNTVTSGRTLNSGSVATDTLPVQTFRHDPDSGGDIVNEIGGANPAVQDAGVVNIGDPLPATAQSITEITTPDGTTVNNDTPGLDFGFNFDTIVNTNDSGQGSLRQFIQNSNALFNDITMDQVQNPNDASLNPAIFEETSIFMIPETDSGYGSTTIDGGTGNAFVIQLSTPLPTITDDNTVIDGRMQTALTGDDHTAVADRSTGPEVIIDANNTNGTGLHSTGRFTRIDSIGIGNTANNPAIHFEDHLGDNNFVAGVLNSTTFNAGSDGVRIEDSDTVTVFNNILRESGQNDSDGRGVHLIGTDQITVDGNRILENAGYGIGLITGDSRRTTISNNQIRSNGQNSTQQQAGIGILSGDNSIIQDNTISLNQGDGIVITSGNTGHQITQNSIFDNEELGIDLSGDASADGDAVTPNDNGDGDSGANDLLNFPVIESAELTGNTLVVKGYAPPGATVELFVADDNPGNPVSWPSGYTTDFGEGATYLTTLVEGSGNDTDGTQSTYLNDGTGSILPKTQNRFEFTLNVAALPVPLTISTPLTATASVPKNNTNFSNTSEFSGNTPVSDPYVISPLAGQVIINEVLYRQTSTSKARNDEFIELYNASNSAIDLGGLKLIDGNLLANALDGPTGSITGNTSPYIFPPNTIVPAGEYVVIWIGEQTPDKDVSGSAGVAFQAWLGNAPKLRDNAEDIWLYDDQNRIIDYIAYGQNQGTAQAVIVPPPESLGLWDTTYQVALRGADNGQSISLTPNGQDGNTSACWEHTTSGNASSSCTNFKTTRDTDLTDDDAIPDNDSSGERITSVGENNNGEPELILVKRITAINGDRTQNPRDNTTLNTFMDGSGDDDNDSQWPTNFLLGAIDAGQVMPGDEVEYTIYFLSKGETQANNVKMCDRIPNNLTYVLNAYNSDPPAPGGTVGSGRGILVLLDRPTDPNDNVPLAYTNFGDGDQALFHPVGQTLPSHCNGSNDNGAVVVNLGGLPNATAAGTPTDSYGFFRFKATVD